MLHPFLGFDRSPFSLIYTIRRINWSCHSNLLKKLWEADGNNKVIQNANIITIYVRETIRIRLRDNGIYFPKS